MVFNANDFKPVQNAQKFTQEKESPLCAGRFDVDYINTPIWAIYTY